MVDKLVLQVGEYQKSVEIEKMRPASLAKHYASYIRYHQQRRSKAESSLYTEVKMIRYLFSFLESNDINSLRHFEYLHMQELFTFLNTCTSKQGKLLSKSSQRLVYTFFKNFVSWLAEYHPKEAPKMYLFGKSPYHRNNVTVKTVYFTDDVLKQIKKALSDEKDIVTKTYLLLSLYCGLRSSDIVTLKEDCLHHSDKKGKYDLHYIDHKQKEAVILPAIATPVSQAILTLKQYTSTFRQEASSSLIFLYKDTKGKIKYLKPYQKTLLDNFAKRHDITDTSNIPIKIQSHMFRRTLATNLQSSGVALETTQRILNHKSKRTTLKYYVKTKEADYIDQISKTLAHMQILARGQENNYFPTGIVNSEALRLSDGYCTNNAMATEPEYMCEQIKKRGNCYGCEKMVTTPEFLPYFKILLSKKEEELSSQNHYGTHLTAHIHFEKELIESLIEKLEAL